MKSEYQKMIAGEPYHPFDPELRALSQTARQKQASFNEEVDVFYCQRKYDGKGEAFHFYVRDIYAHLTPANPPPHMPLSTGVWNAFPEGHVEYHRAGEHLTWRLIKRAGTENRGRWG